jgi:hypothetical protein
MALQAIITRKSRDIDPVTAIRHGRGSVSRREARQARKGGGSPVAGRRFQDFKWRSKPAFLVPSGAFSSRITRGLDTLLDANIGGIDGVACLGVLFEALK